MDIASSTAPKVTSRNLRVFLAVKDSDQRSHMEDSLVMDGFDVRTFSSAATLWDAFQQRPARMVITERRFGGGLSGLDLTRSIRKHHLLPYIYIVVLSTMSRLQEIKDGLAAGVDDYLIKPPNPLQVRSRVLVGLRWLQYIDSLYEGRA
jgi:sigma-B regulation protein RsbU (phosphoserine phosphatase)